MNAAIVPSSFRASFGRAASSGRAAVGRFVKDILGRILVLFGLHKRLLRGKAIVVAFHSITADRSEGAMRSSRRDFDRYCEFFSKHMRVELLSELVERLEKKGPLDGELSITFDDGYADNAELALPILKRWSLHATFFVTTGFIGSDTQTFWDKEKSVQSRWMTWDQVRELIKAGNDVGAHTVSHADLGSLPDEEVERELRTARDELSARTHKVPTHFAVPFGRAFPSLDRTVGIARGLGFRSVLLCRGGIVEHANARLWIERWPINPGAYLSPYGWIVDVARHVCA
jgi:peptidoglycan/xylan/chitin deacetylase (PgdA/CDA1 family)